MANNEEEKKNNHNDENTETPHVENSENTQNQLEEKVKEMENEIKKKENEIFDLKMENIKLKERLRQESDIYERELKRLVLKEKINIFKEFLEVLDNIERALESLNGDSEHSKGLMLIKDQLFKFLSSYGIKEMDLINKPYDPNIADIGEVIETKDYPQGTVVKVLRKGYYIGDNVLRTAVVAVSKEPSENKNENSSNNSNN